MYLRNHNFWLAILLFLSSTVILNAQFGGGGGMNSPTRQTYTIAGVSVEGNEFADPATIITLSGLRVGSKINPYADNTIQKAIKQLWDRKQFSDIEISIEKIAPIGIFLKISVQEFPRLNDIIVKGNDEIETKDIEDATEKMRGDIISGYELYKVEKSVKALYNEEGLTFAKVKAELGSTTRDAYADMILDIEEGVEFYCSSIVIEGNSAFDDSKLASQFDDTKTTSWYEFWASSKFDKNKYEEDKSLLIRYYKQNGYVDAEILDDSLVYNEETETVQVLLTVSEGKQIFVRNIAFDGNTVYNDDELLRRLDFRKGDSFDKEKFTLNLNGNEEQSDCASLYLDNGYLTARMDPQERRVEGDSVDITINVFENDRFRIRHVKIIGNDKTKDKVIRRELYTRPGDYFSKSSLIRSVRALGMLNYFNPEALKPDVLPVDNTNVDISYTLEERSTDTFNAQIGYAGSFGMTGAIGFTFNNFSLMEPFKGGAGQVFNLNWEFGYNNRLQNFSIGFTEPWLMNTPTTIGFNLYSSKINYGYSLKRLGVGMNIGRRFRWPDDYWRGDWNLRIQQNDITEGGSYYYLPGQNTELTIGQTLSRISLNSPFFATSGSKFTWGINYAMGNIGLGSVDYLKNEVTYEMYNPLLQVQGNDRLVFAMKANWGYLTYLDKDSTISPIDYYYMGGNGLSGIGVTPLRGYDDRAIGGYNWNRVMSKYTAELRLALSVNPMPIYVFGFAEAGNVWTGLSSTDPFDLKRSAGIGIQMLVQPIGILGFSYGYGFDKPTGGTEVSGWRFLFHLGPQ